MNMLFLRWCLLTPAVAGRLDWQIESQDLDLAGQYGMISILPGSCKWSQPGDNDTSSQHIKAVQIWLQAVESLLLWLVHQEALSPILHDPLQATTKTRSQLAT